ncbi:Myosin-binding protein [Actinidia chinensis var. chinensis]|uniref:Myosin-binding protein n=1 Tax=Actinidia chinensis var. chinensis TaxID=1590841 RepID=A0A2R6PHE5_ACTCC|nr:Myosin-binding protein [Actinidia chinensis var. chinensis]
MVANKFATMLHRNSNKLTLILIYAVLEWILIVLLLLNSLFSYLIIKFADYFGLKTPCLWCSRVDHIFDPQNSKNSHRDLLCEAHAAEISKLGYCSNHRKLSESQDMCEDCSSSQPNAPEILKNLAFFPWVKEIGMSENGELDLKCSCCGVGYERKFCSPCIVIKPSWGNLDYTQKGSLIGEEEDDDRIEESDNSDGKISDFLMENFRDERCGVGEHEAEVDCSVSLSNSGVRELEGDEDDKKGLVLEEEQEETIIEDNSNLIMEDQSVEILPQHLEFFVGHDGYRLIPVELIDSTTEENQSKQRINEEGDDNCDNHEDNLGCEVHVVERESLGEREEVPSVHEIEEEPKFAVLESVEMEENDNSDIFHAIECDLVREVYEDFEPQTTSVDFYREDGQVTSAAESEERDSDFPAVKGEAFQVSINEIEADVSIGTEIPDLEEPTDDFQNLEILPPYTSINEDPCTSSVNFNTEDDRGSKQGEEESVELRIISVEVRDSAINNQTSQGLDLNETEEERVPDTPTSIESLHQLHKKYLLLEKRESGTEESLDGSVISELEVGEGVVTVEHLKSVLRSERKALHALYTELEEERSASAVAASQTMAMINRLQEEKAAMQMEALQYQRMMEEQSEYDQEALQLLNELMVKREREKEEVERQLEVYRKKVSEYEAKQKMRVLRKSRDGSTRSESSFASSSNGGDCDGLSIDLNQEAKEENGIVEENGNHNTPIDAVFNLEESLANFEEERLLILDRLKVLEEKLFSLDDGVGKSFEDIKSIEDFYEENERHLDVDSNGFGKEMNGRITKGKRLLPLFDVVSEENEVVEEIGHVNGFDSERSIESENKKLAIEEEVDHLYEKLQALEADREFLKHCISSLKKGEKGMDLLQEILQHLRDLRNVDLRVRNLSDGDHCA